MTRIHHRASVILRHSDPRMKLLLLLAACFAGQYLAGPFLAAWVCLLLGLFFLPEMRAGRIRAMLRGGVTFILVWTLLTAGSAALGGAGWAQALAGALPLAGRLFSFTLAGMAYMAFSSPMETGKAVAWFLRPLLRGRAWIPALCVALTAWFLPMTLGVSGRVREGMRARGLRPGPGRRLLLLAGTSLRILENQAADLAVGIASRGLDNRESWEPPGKDGRKAESP